MIFHSSVLAEDAIKAALNDWKVKNQSPDPDNSDSKEKAAMSN